MKNLTRHHILLSDETLSNDVSTNPLKQNNEDNNTTFSNRNSSPALFTSIDMPLNKKKNTSKQSLKFNANKTSNFQKHHQQKNIKVNMCLFNIL